MVVLYELLVVVVVGEVLGVVSKGVCDENDGCWEAPSLLQPAESYKFIKNKITEKTREDGTSLAGGRILARPCCRTASDHNGH